MSRSLERPEHDEIGKQARLHHLIGEIALHFAPRAVGASRRTRRIGDRAHRLSTAAAASEALAVAAALVGGFLRGVDDLLRHSARNAFAEKRHGFRRIGPHEQRHHMGVEQFRGGKGARQHRRVARAAGERCEDFRWLSWPVSCNENTIVWDFIELTSSSPGLIPGDP